MKFCTFMYVFFLFPFVCFVHAAGNSFDSSQLGRIVFGLSSAISVKNLKPRQAVYVQQKAREVAVQSESTLNFFLSGGYRAYSTIDESFHQLNELADGIGSKREIIDKMKPWELRKLRSAAYDLELKCGDHIRGHGTTLSRDEQEKIVTLKQIMAMLREFVFNTKYVHVGNRKDRVFDIVYHRPIEWLWKTRSFTVPAGTAAALLFLARKKSAALDVAGTSQAAAPRAAESMPPASRAAPTASPRAAPTAAPRVAPLKIAAPLKAAPSPEGWIDKKVGSKTIKVIERPPFLQLRSHNQFSDEVSGLCKSSVFCGGLSATLGPLIRNVEDLGKMYELVNDFSELQKRIPRMIAATARLRIQTLFGESTYSGIEDYIRDNGREVDAWVRNASSLPSDSHSRVGMPVVNYIFPHAEQIKAQGLSQWAQQSANGKTHRGHLESITATDWHEKNELEKILESEDNVTVVDDKSLQRFVALPKQDMYSYLSSLNKAVSSDIGREMQRNPLGAFAQSEVFVRRMSQVYRNIQSLRVNGVPQAFLLRFSGHWVSGKIRKKGDGKFEIIFVDTMNSDRTDTPNAQQLYSLFTQEALPPEELFNPYISFSIYEDILNELRGYMGAKERTQAETQNATNEYQRLINQFMNEWISFDNVFASHADKPLFNDRFHFVFDTLIKRYYWEKYSGKMPVVSTSGAHKGEIDITGKMGIREIVEAYKQQQEG